MNRALDTNASLQLKVLITTIEFGGVGFNTAKGVMIVFLSKLIKIRVHF